MVETNTQVGIYTCSARDYADSNSRSLRDYELIPVNTEGCAVHTPEGVTDVLRAAGKDRGLEVITDFRIFSDAGTGSALVGFGTGLKLKQLPKRVSISPP